MAGSKGMNAATNKKNNSCRRENRKEVEKSQRTKKQQLEEAGQFFYTN
jgi:hypothetical protein